MEHERVVVCSECGGRICVDEDGRRTILAAPSLRALAEQFGLPEKAVYNQTISAPRRDSALRPER